MMNEQDKKALQDALSKHGSTFDVVDFSVGFNEGLLAARGQQEPINLQNAPIGTLAPAINGGSWKKTIRGWEWGSGGSTFPRPGGEWNGEFIPPAPVPQISVTEFAKLAEKEMEKHDFHGFGSVVETVLDDLLKNNQLLFDQTSAPARLTDQEIEECEELAGRSFRRFKSSIRGQLIVPQDSYEWHLAQAIMDALEKKRGGV